MKLQKYVEMKSRGKEQQEQSLMLKKMQSAGEKLSDKSIEAQEN